jgi:hypothetical protein
MVNVFAMLGGWFVSFFVRSYIFAKVFRKVSLYLVLLHMVYGQVKPITIELSADLSHLRTCEIRSLFAAEIHIF